MHREFYAVLPLMSCIMMTQPLLGRFLAVSVTRLRRPLNQRSMT